MALVISGSWQNVIVSNKCVQWLLLSESTRGESLWRQENYKSSGRRIRMNSVFRQGERLSLRPQKSNQRIRMNDCAD